MVKTLIVLIGPTGIGKTKTSIKIAQHFNTEIISSDSRQIFRELSIGTAVPKKSQLKLVNHHFIQTHSIHDYYNASMFENDVLNLLDNFYKKHDVAIMTGGSMLYIDAVCNGIDDIPTVDQEIRNSLLKKYDDEGIENLRIQLKLLDPDYYSKVDLKNHKRLLHALEICIMTGKPYSAFMKKAPKQRPFKIIKVGLTCPREELYERINQRVDKMIEDGLIEEAQKVYQFKNLNSLNTVGYKELFDFFDEKIHREEAIEKIKKNSRNYARKQITWFKRDHEIQWFDYKDFDGLLSYLKLSV